jgi:hypothetical protein
VRRHEQNDEKPTLSESAKSWLLQPGPREGTGLGFVVDLSRMPPENVDE